MLTRPRVGSVAIGILAVTAVVLSLMTATSTLAPAVAFAESGHWVVNAAEQAVVHVDGGTAQVDARVELPADVGEPLFAVQGERQGFVVARDRVAVFGRSTLTVDTTIPVEFDEVPVGIETVGGPYLVYRAAGTIVRLGVPPLSLPVGGPVERPVWTDDGTVWLHRPDDGSFCALRAGADVLDCSAGAPGEPGGLSVTSDLAAFVGTRQDAAQVVATALGSPVGLGADVAEAGLLADRDTEGRLAVVEPGVNRLVLADSGGVPAGRAGGDAILVDLGLGEFSSPIASNGVIAVLDVAANRLLTFDTSGRLLSATDLPPGATPTLTRGGDGTIYVDDADGASTHVVGADGAVTSVRTGGLLPDAAAIAAPPERRSPVAPPPTLRQRLDTPALPGPGQVPSVPGGPVLPGSGSPAGPNPPPPNGVLPPPQLIVQPPAAPTGVTAQVRGAAVVVSWQPVDGAGRPVTYSVRLNGADPRETAATTVTYDPAPVGQPLIFRVRATAGGTEGPESAPSAPVTIAGDPIPPTNLAATMTGPNSGASTWTVSWDEPDLVGGELLHYLVEVGADSTYRQTTVTTTSTQIQLINCETEDVEVSTVTRGSADPPRRSRPAQIDAGADRDCTINGRPQLSESAGGTNLNIVYDGGVFGASAACSVTFNGTVGWTGTCRVDQYQGAIRAQLNLERNTTYEVVLRIDAPTPGSRATESAPIFHTTRADCTTDPLPAGC